MCPVQTGRSPYCILARRSPYLIHPVEPKKVLCIHDLSGMGRCSLAVILPVLSVMGVQPVALPTVVLSTHTGGLAPLHGWTALPTASRRWSIITLWVWSLTASIPAIWAARHR